MRRIIFFVVFWSGFAIDSVGFAGSITLHGTGFDASGNALSAGGVDASWSTTNDPISGGAGRAFFIAPGNPDWWVGSGGADTGYAANTNTATFQGSGWVSDNASSSFNGPAPYTFSMQFDLSSLVLSTVSISGRWSVADQGTLSVNGHQVVTLGEIQWTQLHPFSITDTALLNPGLNTMSITVTVADQFDEGARFEGTVTGTAVPEPSSLVLGIIASVACGSLYWRRRRGRARKKGPVL